MSESWPGRSSMDASISMASDRFRTTRSARTLTGLIGIGPWTADVYLLSCLRRPDVWPVFDRALQVSTAEVLGLETAPDPAQLLAIGERWRPHRSTAARIMWHSYLSRRGRTKPDLRSIGRGLPHPDPSSISAIRATQSLTVIRSRIVP